MTTVTPSAATAAIGGPPVDWHALTPADTAGRQGVDPARGLDTGEVAVRRARVGPNRFAEQAGEPAWRMFLRQYADLMQIVLLVAGALSIYPIKQAPTGALLIILTVLNAYLGVHQEGKAATAVAALQRMMIVRARVRRNGELVELPAEELVPGDVVLVEAGDLIPADGRIIRAATLEIGEAALTGESVPSSKDATAVVATAELGDRACMAYMNTNVTRGSGELIVTATGMATEVGHISGMLQAQERQVTPLTRQIEALTQQLLAIAGVSLAASIAIGLARGESFDVLFVTAVAFAVSAVPTGLPTVITTILSRGTQSLAAAGAIVKNLRSVETLGSTSAINSDKTGTLTLNQMTAVQLAVPGRRYTVSGSGYGLEGTIQHVAGEPEVRLDAVLQPCVLCSDAVIRDGELIGDPTEGALVVLAEKGGVSTEATRSAFPRVATLPFDAAYKLMATFHHMTDESGREVVRAFIKGAPDGLLSRGSEVIGADLVSIRPVDDELRSVYLAENDRMGALGLRVMATGRKDFDPAAFDPGADLLAAIDGLTLLALVGIVDPPRPAAKPSIATARAAGIRVRMITGDHAATAAAIARDLGIEGRALPAAEFHAMSDEEAMRELDGIGVIARVTPEDKVRLVDLLRRKGHVVAMTGDGVNDAPALKKADIGIAMGITGTEVSKEAAAMILTDDDFSTIVHAVELGRGLFDNLRKYIRFQVGGLIAFIGVFLGSSILNVLGGVPFVPLQTLWLNFTTQLFLAIGLGYGQPVEGLMARRPRPAEQPILPRRTLAWLAVVGLVMGGSTLGLLYWANGVYDTATARTMGLTALAVANVALAIGTRDERRSMFSVGYFADRHFLFAIGGAIAAIVLQTELRLFQRLLGTVSLDLGQWVLCVAIGLLVLVVYEVRKALWTVPDDSVADAPVAVPAAV
jgi:P-type Ca2+ transporter type 2C